MPWYLRGSQDSVWELFFSPVTVQDQRIEPESLALAASTCTHYAILLAQKMESLIDSERFYFQILSCNKSSLRPFAHRLCYRPKSHYWRKCSLYLGPLKGWVRWIHKEVREVCSGTGIMALLRTWEQTFEPEDAGSWSNHSTPPRPCAKRYRVCSVEGSWIRTDPYWLLCIISP